MACIICLLDSTGLAFLGRLVRARHAGNDISLEWSMLGTTACLKQNVLEDKQHFPGGTHITGVLLKRCQEWVCNLEQSMLGALVPSEQCTLGGNPSGEKRPCRACWKRLMLRAGHKENSYRNLTRGWQKVTTPSEQCMLGATGPLGRACWWRA